MSTYTYRGWTITEHLYGLRCWKDGRAFYISTMELAKAVIRKGKSHA